MNKSEARVQQEVRLAAPLVGSLLHRNNVGVLPDRNGTPVRFGLANDSREMNTRFKSADLIGWTEYTIRPEDVGKTFAIYTSVEVKESGWSWSGAGREVAQARWRDLVLSAGGFAGFASTVEGFLQIVRRR